MHHRRHPSTPVLGDWSAYCTSVAASDTLPPSRPAVRSSPHPLEEEHMSSHENWAMSWWSTQTSIVSITCVVIDSSILEANTWIFLSLLHESPSDKLVICWCERVRYYGIHSIAAGHRKISLWRIPASPSIDRRESLSHRPTMLSRDK